MEGNAPWFWPFHGDISLTVATLIGALLVLVTIVSNVITFLWTRSRPTAPQEIECRELVSSSFDFERLSLRVSGQLQYNGDPIQTQLSLARLSFRNIAPRGDNAKQVQLRITARGPEPFRLIGIEPFELINPNRLSVVTQLPVVSAIPAMKRNADFELDADIEFSFLNSWHLDKDKLGCTLVFDGPVKELLRPTIIAPAGWGRKFRSIDWQRAWVVGVNNALLLILMAPMFAALPSGFLNGWALLTWPAAIATMLIWALIVWALSLILQHRRESALRNLQALVIYIDALYQSLRKR